jgi:dTDP-4-amino-4,6-dideoxygalactose transaminase
MKVTIPITRPYIGDEEKRLVSQVIESGWVSQGPKVAEFEKRFAEYVGARCAVATTSCTTALHSALSVSGIGEGDEVIVPSLSFIATANAVIHCGAVPVFVDINPETCNIDVEKIEEAITDNTKAVIPVHQMGLPADIETVSSIARKHGLKVIEDAACAIGSAYRGKKIGGHHGTVACFSLHPRKVITTGEGGMITTDDEDFAARLKRFRHHGMSISDIERHESGKVITESYPEIGYNYRMTDIQGAMGLVQLDKLPSILDKRRQIAALYDRELGNIPHIKVPGVPGHVYHNYQSYWIELLHSAPVSRDVFMQSLLEKGIATRRGIMAIHLERCYRKDSLLLPETERITKNTVLLPIYPSLTEEEQMYVIQCIKEVMQ